MIKFKVLLIGSIQPPHHGSNIYFENLLNSKIGAEFEIHHLDTSDHRDLNNLSKLEITNVYLAVKNLIELSIKLIKEKPNLVYVPISASFLPYLRDGLFILFSKWFSKAKIVIHLHGGDYFRKEFYEKSNFIVKYFIKLSLEKVDCAIVLSNNLKSTFKDLVRNIDVAFNGIDYTFISDENKKNNHIIKIGYLGNLFITKGILDLIEAYGIVTKNNKADTVLEFAGSYFNQDAAKDFIRSFVKKNNLSSKVFHLGILKGEEKEKFLNELDIFVFLSYNEGSPLVILEAMAAGLPVIATPVGSIPEVVIDGETGFIIEKKNPRAAADAIIKLLEDPELRVKMGKEGRKRYEEHFTLDKNITRIIEIFMEVIGNKYG